MKKIFACFLCLILVAIPLVQRSYAVVTTTTVVVILILTLLTAMGITLVIAEGSKEAFIEQKGDEFMQSKGYSGSFADWIKGQSDIQLGLKVGFFMLAKDVVDRIKEFVGWLIPNATSDSVVDLNNGSISGLPETVVIGTLSYDSVKQKLIVTPESTWQSIVLLDNGTLTDGTNSCWCRRPNPSGQYQYGSLGYYDNNDIFHEQRLGGNGNDPWGVFYLVEDFFYNGLTYKSGFYFNRQYYTYGTCSFYTQRDNNRAFLPSSFDISQSSDASAIIGNYDDLSDLSDKTVTENGTTTIYNTFYISQDGQALDGTGQDLADIVGALQQALDDLNRRLEIIPQTAETAAEGTVTPDYSDFNLGDLDLSGLGALLTTRFPFSIPWDFVRIFTLFSADPVAPSWEVDLLPLDDFENVDTTVTLDLGQYPIVGQVSRWFCIIDLCLGLCFITKRLIWVA